jgi:hypothetical protein
VYDSITKEPLDPAYVVLKNESGEITATAITDIDGRYGFLVPSGTYTMEVSKTNYLFPSKKAVGKIDDDIYTSLYFGGPFEVDNDKPTIVHDVPMDALALDWNQVEKLRRREMKFYSPLGVIFRKIFLVLFYLGFAYTLMLAFVQPTSTTWFILALYTLVIIFRSLSFKPHVFGRVVDEAGETIPYANVVILSQDGSVEIRSVIADMYGRYYALVAPGEYKVQVKIKEGSEEYKTVLDVPNVSAKRGYISTTLVIRNGVSSDDKMNTDYAYSS